MQVCPTAAARPQRRWRLPPGRPCGETVDRGPPVAADRPSAGALCVNKLCLWQTPCCIGSRRCSSRRSRAVGGVSVRLNPVQGPDMTAPAAVACRGLPAAISPVWMPRRRCRVLIGQYVWLHDGSCRQAAADSRPPSAEPSVRHGLVGNQCARVSTSWPDDSAMIFSNAKSTELFIGRARCWSETICKDCEARVVDPASCITFLERSHRCVSHPEEITHKSCCSSLAAKFANR